MCFVLFQTFVGNGRVALNQSLDMFDIHSHISVNRPVNELFGVEQIAARFLSHSQKVLIITFSMKQVPPILSYRYLDNRV